MKYKTKLRKGDEVIVLAGKDKGKKGKILRILTENQKAIVSEINKVKKHKKPGNNEPGGIVDKEMPIQISNIAYFDAKSNKPVKIGFKISKDKKVRFNKNSGKEI
ncbi:MAG: 50S ribosomal protein L24 [Alphaproteobacteria bacterium MarineAlpha5_Bin5]|mgnify:FL=1|nr:MAG: 50S ribosomal protein L24 [Alphaproteobacteria bacterium MarineAlpha5_Bin4]PPR50789.1 MAG: 50S ribosomal protein L24 [Alphaproteobacteria bacterium MarineAlpha5_Bin5]|tara:strand:- start:5349 stop:5663 length:315 start_codon:yes stop_codon:yes gene_type:complete